MESFYSLVEHPREEIEALLALANRLREYPEPRALEGKVLAMLFLSPSLRTLASFQAAMSRLGGGAFVISPEMSIHGLETRDGIVMDGRAAEHVQDAIPVIASYGDAMAIRAFADRESLQNDLADTRYRSMAKLVNRPLINMESAAQHPCQALADWKTMDDLGIPRSGGKLVLSWVYHPRPLPLSGPISTLQMAALRGMDVTVLSPPGFELPPAVMDEAREVAAIAGGSVSETGDRDEALRGAHALFAKEWSSVAHYGNSYESIKTQERHADWCVDEKWLAPGARGCRFFHAMPVRRGVSVHDHVLDGPCSALIPAAANRMWTQMAILYQMLRH